jgi:hypothetical protein
MNSPRPTLSAATAASSLLLFAHCGTHGSLGEGNAVIGDAGGESATPAPAAVSGDAQTGSCTDAGCVEGGSDAPSDAHWSADSGPFMCGEITCVAGQYCTDRAPNIPGIEGGPPDTFICVPIPMSCMLTSVTCDCIESSITPGDGCSPQTPGVTCTVDGYGNVTLHCKGL